MTNGSRNSFSQTHPQDVNNKDAISANSVASGEHLPRDLAEDAGTGFARSGEVLAKTRMDLSLAIAQGFHNAPALIVVPPFASLLASQVPNPV